MRNIRPKEIINRITILIIASTLITVVLIIRLFQLQILQYDHYSAIAAKEQYGFSEQAAQRGEIIIKDHHSDEEFYIATNTTLNLIFADPALIDNPEYVGGKIAPLLFDLEYEQKQEELRIKELSKNLNPELTKEEIETLLKPRTKEELKKDYVKEIIRKIGEKQRQEVQFNINAEQATQIKQLKLTGIELTENKMFAYPSQINNRKQTANKLAPILEMSPVKLEKILKGENRYVILKRRVEPNISKQIKEFQDKEKKVFRGIGMKDEHFRFYPEGSLGANFIGYIDRSNIGQYGIESSYNTELQGVAGEFKTKQDSIGRQITDSDSILKPAIDGDDIVLTIDRSVQSKVEQILAKDTQYYRADSGQILIMNPKTGAIIAMAHYPSFDPNNFGDVFNKVEIELNPEEIENLVPSKTEENQYYFYRNTVTLDKYLIFEKTDENNNKKYYRYENFVGPEVYHNKIISWPYEPGSVFKSITMAIAIDAGEVSPDTTFNDEGPIGVDWRKDLQKYEYEIKNSHGYFGLIDMNTVLAESLNTGMTYIAKKMGGALFYSYLDKFGFLDRTDIEFDNESVGKIEYFEEWTESELATHSFGQGLTVTMIQLANAYSVLANGGILMQPYIVEETRHHDGKTTYNEANEIRRVISEESSDKITAMLVNAVENGVASKGMVDRHKVAGKTGTSQTYKHGRALSGSGTTITGFAGYGPIEDPQFVIIVKFDHPRSSEWGSETAAPTFSKIASYLFDYYNIPPDK